MMTERKCTLPILIPHGRCWLRKTCIRGEVPASAKPPNGYAEQELRPEVVAALEKAA